jgi:hypothetical protein
VETVFHHTQLPLQKWFLAIDLFLAGRTKPTSRTLGKYLGVNKNTACYMIMRIRKAMAEPEQRRFLHELIDNQPTEGAQNER